MSDDYTFESTDAGASDTFPCEAGQIRKGGFIMIKGHPCKVCFFASPVFLAEKDRTQYLMRMVLWLCDAGCQRVYVEDRQARPRQV